MSRTTTFQSALDTAEALPFEQQEDLLDVLRRRLTDSRREAMAQTLREARAYSCGKVKKGSVDDLLMDIAS